jgi:hypothetical protein
MGYNKHIPNIIIVCDEEWGDMWMSKHHYAHELAKLKYTVYFINPPERWTPLNLFKKPRVKRIDSIYVVNLANRFPILAIRFLAILNDRITHRTLIKKNILQKKSLIWNFDGRRFGSSNFKKYKSIYHIVDNNKNAILDNESSLNASLIICVSQHFALQYPNVICPVISIPHGISPEEFSTDDSTITKWKNEFGNYFVSAGSFSNKTNLKLLQLISNSFPDKNLVLLGKSYLDTDPDWIKLIQSRNVHFLGTVPAKTLKNYIAAAKICLTTYHYDHATSINAGAGSSLKHMNYLAQNKITISTLSNDINSVQNKGIYSATSDEQFIKYIQDSLEGKLELDENLITQQFENLLYPVLIERIFFHLFKESKAEKIASQSATIQGQNIIVISNEKWGDIWYSKHNYAHELSKNNNVIFVNPLENWSPASLFNSKIVQTKIGHNLSELNYKNAVPARGLILTRLNNWVVSKRLKAWFKTQGMQDYISWSFDPFRLYNAKAMGAKIGIFHCVDLYGFNYYGEDRLCKTSDVLLISATKFYDTYKNYGLPKFHVPHGISEEEFDTSGSNPEIEFSDYGLYTGVIDNRTDFALLEKALINFPEIQFVFIGPLKLPVESEIATRIFKENKYFNLHAIGPKSFKSLKYYIKQARFCISFMDTSNPANMLAHNKTLLYLAQGKPIFSPSFKEYDDWSSLMYMRNSAEDILKSLADFINEGEAKSLTESRIEFARKFSFEKILMEIHRNLSTIDKY